MEEIDKKNEERVIVCEQMINTVEGNKTGYEVQGRAVTHRVAREGLTEKMAFCEWQSKRGLVSNTSQKNFVL
jgi:hypothetical protein